MTSRRNAWCTLASSTCGGWCCESFTLPWAPTPQALRDRLAREEASGSSADLADVRIIADMAVPLFTETKRDRTVWFFGCRHFDKTTRLCQIYETRPKMCRTYPNGGRCGHSQACSYRGK